MVKLSSLTLLSILAAAASGASVVDTYISSGLPDNSYAAATAITVDGEDEGGRTFALLKIGVPTSLPTFAYEKILLRLYTTNWTPETVTGYRMTSFWDDTHTWNDLNGAEGMHVEIPSISFTGPSSNEYLELDVTSDVEAWMSGSEVNHGWIFKTHSNSTDGWDFSSGEGTNKPQIAFAGVPFGAEDTYIWRTHGAVNVSLVDITVDGSDYGEPTQSLIKFPGLENLPAESLLRAEASFRQNSPTSDDAAVSGYRMIQSWEEHTVEWADFDDANGILTDGSDALAEPSFIVPNTGYSCAECGSGFKTVDVLDDAIAWFSGDINQGWVLKCNSTDGWDFDSSEVGDPTRRPKLEVDFVYSGGELPPPPATTTAQATSTTTESPTTTTDASEGVEYVFDASADTEIDSYNPTEAFGSADTISIDKDNIFGGISYGLIRFNLAVIAGKSVTKAQLKLFVHDRSYTSASIQGFKMMKPWGESSTWADLIDGDEAATAASWTIPEPGITGEKIIDVDIADLNSWLAGEENNGWIIKSSSTNGFDFYASERSELTRIPQLFLTVSDEPATSTTLPATTTASTTLPATTTTVAPITVTIKGTKVSDTTIRETSPDTPQGSSIVLEVDESSTKHILLKFDLDEITGGRITFAELKMNQFDEGNLGSLIRGHRMYKPWNEDSTWGTLGGPYPDGSNAATVPSFAIEHPQDIGIKYMNVKADVNAWVNGGEDNQGWLIVSDSSNGLDFHSSETVDGPELTVTYIPGDISPTPAPTDAPTKTPPMCPNGPASYYPGKLETLLGTDYGDSMATGNILVSKGLTGRVLTRKLQPVPVAQGGPTFPMHEKADGAATLPDDNDPNKYFYVSNSETGSKTSTMGADGSGGGGVGILHFDATKTPHEVIGYERAAYDTESGGRNCGGGRTPWGTWLTSEESGDGQVIEVDPNTGDWCQTPLAPPEGGNYESNAFYKHPVDGKYHFYTTDDDSSNYRLTRFITQRDATDLDNGTNKPRLCDPNDKYNRIKMEDGSITFLHLVSDGTYYWDTERSENVGGDVIYPNAEGIDVKGDQLYFVTKGQKKLYIVDLDSNTWTETRTLQDDNSYFSPDQIARITGSNSPEDILYFAEDGSGSQDVHARGIDPDDGEYKFYTIIKGYSSTESTGLTFSPDNKYMYFAHQSNSEIWQIWREDGCEFGNGSYIDVLYHDGQRRQLGLGEGGLRGGVPLLRP